MSKKILWSFNPFQDEPQLLKNVAGFLKILARQAGAPIEPVYVVSPAEVNVVLEFSVPAKDRFAAVAQLECEKVLKKIAFPGLRKATVLVESQVRLSASAKTLAQYAKKCGAAAVVVGTHAKSGLGRLLLGSFAETLIFASQTPLLIVNPHLKKPRALRRVLFASDFSPDSRRVFRRLCEFLKPLKSQLTLFHAIPKPFPWAFPATQYLLGARSMSEGEYLREVEREDARMAEPFLKIAKAARLPCQLQLKLSGDDVAAAALAQAAKAKADMIALSAQTGRVETALLGSTSRGILREASVPVWVLR
ncbi:MAG: universal stress protein [bacterium]